MNLDLIFDELNDLIPSNPSVKYNFIYFSFDVSKAYLLIVVNDNDEDNLDGSISDELFSVSLVESLFFDSSSFFFFSTSYFFFSSHIK